MYLINIMLISVICLAHTQKERQNQPAMFDLLISTDATGLKFYGLVEDIRTALHKKVDVLDINQLKDNFELTQEILKDGVKIYG